MAGVYDELMTRELTEAFGTLAASTEPVEVAEQALEMSRLIGSVVSSYLEGLKPEERITKANEILASLGSDQLLPGPHKLLALDDGSPGTANRLATRPAVPLAQAALLTNSNKDPSLGAEIRAELATADRVDLLCAFVKFYGLRVLETELRQFKERGGQLRVITTTYLGSTERKALDRLVREFGAQVRITYETNSTRLHAKAWLFRRATGLDTAYVGSSNLSRTALLDGLEWNVKLAGAQTPDILAKFEATFDSYWESPEFLAYDPEVDGPQLDQALAVAAGVELTNRVTHTVSGLEVRPLPHQKVMLEQLEAERVVRDRHRNLVVAATGTGKTVVSALDYARQPGRPRLLFLAHRKEILEQSLRTFREVLADGAFGELYVGGTQPSQWQHVFASVQSLNASDLDAIAPDHFQFVVVDEFHHAHAATYRRLLQHLTPAELLGLTATPERSDGFDVRSFFDGCAAVELRLWDALEADLLCPFHYFGISDATDLSTLDWRAGDYSKADLEQLYTADDSRVRIVLRELLDRINDVEQMKALGFCVSVKHAEYMANRFRAAGINALAVSGQTPPAERDSALRDLRQGTVNVLFAVDLFNEGLDIPDVDTLLLLRPTQSATIFLQQLGRGLRRTPQKPVLTVLDFIGQQRREFRFDLKYRALVGGSRKRLQHQLEDGFAFLPSGCELVFDRVAQETVLESVRRQLRLSKKELVAEIRSLGDLPLREWLIESGRDLRDVLRFGSWTQLRREASLPTASAGQDDEKLLKRTGAFAHVDDPRRAATYVQILSEKRPYQELSKIEQTLARMLFFSFWPDGGDHASFEDGLESIRRHPAVVSEVSELVELAIQEVRSVPVQLEDELGVPLAVGARYSREEILAAIDYANLSRTPKSFMTGVAWSPESQIDALFVTLKKTEREYSPTTLYRDFAISPELFHWESQNATSEGSKTGQRYVHHKVGGSSVVLFARQSRENEWGGPDAYVCLGPAEYVSHVGDQPMAITWRLMMPMSAVLFEQAKLVA